MGFIGGEQHALQVIVLGAGGGPLEDNVTAFLVRASASGWKKGSVMAVDGGVGLAAISRILHGHKQNRPFTNKSAPSDGVDSPIALIDGPFEGLEIPSVSSSANAKYIYRELIDTVLFTHPHLDHIMGAVINTATPAPTRQKRFAGLPNTIEALKLHIFNNAIWPNLTDENNGAGMISYIRLVEGGSPAAGQGYSKGYVEVAPGLGVKAMSISHGTCIENHTHRGNTPLQTPSPFPGEGPRLGSPMANNYMQRSNSVTSSNLNTSVPMITGGTPSPAGECVYNSSVFFIRDSATGKEILIFGDIEPDPISLSPRNHLVWKEAAPKIASGKLTGIFIECSYANSRDNDQLFGHMKPTFLMQELKMLGDYVINSKNSGEKSHGDRDYSLISPKRKRDRAGSVASAAPDDRNSKTPRQQSPIEPENSDNQPSNQNFLVPRSPHNRRRGSSASANPSKNGPLPSYPEEKPEDRPFLPLKGLRVVIVHVKENLDDGIAAADIIRNELRELEGTAGLGCEFIISHSGLSLYF
ncbi:related to 3`,5`-cyclic-nucleotide phosphodiesterase [Rhynchosporium agropyri]|uniref:Related to 3`,5`-cyclic-nucleotide phosphodiesterase n=1 Tax=Rhynchosporium agropyri TaxID=914238 RepID=A0A1E1KP74_9HELO|nr:related to 3`,5`-cyclic-nucleotide phosphodiesterase [Rhynchosporium agropyri]